MAEPKLSYSKVLHSLAWWRVSSKELPIDISSRTILPVAFLIENILELSAHVSQPCNLPSHTSICTHQARPFGASLLHILLLPHIEYQDIPAWAGSGCQKGRWGLKKKGIILIPSHVIEHWAVTQGPISQDSRAALVQSPLACVVPCSSVPLLCSG